MNRSIKSKKMQVMQGVASVSCLLLGLLVLALLSPMAREEALATCATGDGEENCVSTQATTELMLNLKTAIAVALDNQVEMEVTPRSDGATSYATTKLNVSTNSNDGYGLFLATGSKDGNLVSVAANNGAVISNTEQNNVLLSELGSNSYGYALESGPASDTTKYSHVPTESTVVKSTKSVTATDLEYAYGDTYYLSFGTKIGTDIPAGSYSGTVTVSAVANPRTIAYLSDLTYMQDMTKSICTNTREGYTKQLIDTRDGKSYWVAKLKDGNCWMTQNLALDLGTGNDPNLKYVSKLTPADSDVSEEWVPESSTNAYNFDYHTFDQELFDFNSWNLGKTVIALPLNNGGDCDLDSESLGYGNGSFTINPGVVCREQGLVDVSGLTWQPTFVSRPGGFDGNNYTLVAVDENNQTYDAHYLLGNYYQFSTATVGSLSLPYVNNTSAPHSICPKGWQLPNNGVTDSFKPLGMEKSFYNLLLAYGYPSSDDWDGLKTSLLNFGLNSEKNPLAPPIYFTASGDISIIDNDFYGANMMVEIWSGTTIRGLSSSQTSRASKLQVTGLKVYISTEMYNSAYNIRCLAR